MIEHLTTYSTWRYYFKDYLKQNIEYNIIQKFIKNMFLELCSNLISIYLITYICAKEQYMLYL